MKLIDADKLFAAFEDADWFDNADRDIAEDVLLNAPEVNQIAQPDPDTGLVPCGVCGKSPTYEEFNDGFFDLDRVECRGCGVMVTSACGKSKAKWNAMRGVKGAGE